MGSERENMTDAARRGVEDAKARLSDAAGKIRDEASSAGRTISELIYDELDRRGADLGEGLHHIAEKMRGMADEGDGQTPRMVTQAVDMIDSLSQRLRHQSAREMGERVAQFGRDNPMTFMAACLATGVIAGRFLIAHPDDDPDDWQNRSRGGTGPEEWVGGPYGRQEWQGTRGSRQGDFGYREPLELDRGDMDKMGGTFATSGLGAGFDTSRGTSGMGSEVGPDDMGDMRRDEELTAGPDTVGPTGPSGRGGGNG